MLPETARAAQRDWTPSGAWGDLSSAEGEGQNPAAEREHGPIEDEEADFKQEGFSVQEHW